MTKLRIFLSILSIYFITLTSLAYAFPWPNPQEITDTTPTPTSTSTASTNVTETPVTTSTTAQPSATLIAIIVGIAIGAIFILCTCLYRRRRQRILPSLAQTPRTMIGRPGASYESAKRLEASSLEFRNRSWDEPMSNIYKSAETHTGSGADGSEVKTGDTPNK